MSRLPRVTAKEIIRVFERLGFRKHHQVGSHAIFKSADGSRRVVVAIHPRQIIPPKTLKSILKDAGLTPTEFQKLL